MATDSSLPLSSPFETQAALELFHAIACEEPSYLWNPADPETEAYLSELEQDLTQLEISEIELTAQAATFSQYMEGLWSNVEPLATVEAPARLSRAEQVRQLLAQIPQQCLDQIRQRAQQVLASNLSLADQLVICVQGVLPELGEDDLQVLARPLAYAMRGAESEVLEAALRSVRCAAWTELSKIEQARLSLAIARYTLAQASSDWADED